MPHKKAHKKTRKLKGGFYSFQGALATGAPSWGRGTEYGDFSMSRVGNNGIYGRGRSKKKTMKSKKSLKKRMRGGSKFGATASSFTGTGERGMANYVQTSTKFPPFGPAAGGAFNNAGAQSLANNKSFDILPK